MMCCVQLVACVLLFQESPQGLYREIVNERIKTRQEIVTLTITGSKFVGGVPFEYEEMSKQDLDSLISAVGTLVEAEGDATRHDHLKPVSRTALTAVTDPLFPSGGNELRPTTPTGGWRKFRIVGNKKGTQLNSQY